MTDVTIEPVETPPGVVTEPAIAPGPPTPPRQRPSPRRAFGGISAIGAKELRGRMRGRRAFAILTIYLLLLGAFAWMVELLMERSYASGFGSSAAYASASIGQGIFAAILMLETLQVVFLAPAATAGAISLEREKQTLDMLIATPISSLAIVIGKLLSALTYVFLLIVASVPLTAVVFVYGGVGPDDVLRGYLVLLVTAIGLGSFGLLCSSLVRRTQAATAISIFGVLSITVGSLFVLAFWAGMANSDNGRGFGPIKGRAPEVIALVNPFIAQSDVLCGTETTQYGTWCSIVNVLVPNQNGIINIDNRGGGQVVVPLPAPIPDIKAQPGFTTGGVTIDANGNQVAIDANGNPIAADVVAFGAQRDAFWPKSVVTWLILSVVFILLSVQLVSPTRRWRFSRQRRTATGTPA
jgi:ABC-type transport system involved in multi-copper enzyme maturation permease subunit